MREREREREGKRITFHNKKIVLRFKTTTKKKFIAFENCLVIFMANFLSAEILLPGHYMNTYVHMNIFFSFYICVEILFFVTFNLNMPG